MKRIGIDLGGTKIESALLDEDNSVLQRKRIWTPDAYEGILDSICDLVSELDSDDARVGVCAPGFISDDGTVRNSNTASLRGRRLQRDLEAKLGRAILMENDANCFAMAEARLGAAHGCSTVFGVIMGTGVGGGIILDGKVHKGRSRIAGEWGHHILHSGGRECYCGGRGCAETYISGPALERRWRELSGDRMRLEDAARYLDTIHGRRWKAEFLADFGVALANVIDILDPDAIVLGGGVSNLPFLYTQGAAAVRERVFGGMVDTPILRNALGDSSGVCGAALLE